MGETVVVAVCDPNGALGGQLKNALLQSPDVQIEFLLQPEELLSHALGGEVACVVLEIAYCLNSQQSTTAFPLNRKSQTLPPLLCLAGKSEQVENHFSDWSGFTDWLRPPVEQRLLEKRLELLIGLHRLEQTTALYEDELEAKSLELEVLQQEMLEKNYRLELLSSLDGLTGLFNNYYFNENLQKEWRQSLRQEEPLSLLLINVDSLESYNEQYGREEGDELLCELASVLHRTLLRPLDIVARYGGDTFAAILPKTDKPGAQLVSERMLENVAGMKKEHRRSGTTGVVTVTIGGVTTVPSKEFKFSDLLEQAHGNLDTAKVAGGNRALHT